MKKALIFSLALFCTSSLAFSQGEFDAYKMSQTDLKGTARSVSMGGAFGALGGDISGIAINPAGIGIYTGSEIVTTMNFRNSTYKTDYEGYSLKEKKFKFNFDNFAFVHSIPLFSDAVPRFNIGFSYNRLKSFDRKVSMGGNNLSFSQTDLMAKKAFDAYRNAFEYDGTELNFDLREEDDNKWANYNYNWLGLFGVTSGLVNQYGGDFASARGILGINSDMILKEKGSIDSYDFNFGTNISDLVSLGMTLSVTDLNYKLYSSYGETFYDGNLSGYYDLENWMKTEGTGWQVAIGAIIKPIDELRIGVAYHSPTWYNMTDYYSAHLGYNLSGLRESNMHDIDFSKYGNQGSGGFYSDEGYESVYDYKVQTPGKWTFSLASVIGTKAIISVDYDLIDYKQMKLKDGNSNSSSYGAENSWIKEDFKLSSVLRIGGEYRITPQLSARVGYSWAQSPFEATFKKNEREAMTAGTNTIFTLDGDTHHYTWGLGYRFTKNFYTDIAFVYKQQKDDLYTFSSTYLDDGSPDIVATPATLKTSTFQGLLTLGFKF